MRHSRVTLPGLNYRALEPVEEHESGAQLVGRVLSSDELAELSDDALIAYSKMFRARDVLVKSVLVRELEGAK